MIKQILDFNKFNEAMIKTEVETMNNENEEILKLMVEMSNIELKDIVLSDDMQKIKDSIGENESFVLKLKNVYIRNIHSIERHIGRFSNNLKIKELNECFENKDLRIKELEDIINIKEKTIVDLKNNSSSILEDEVRNFPEPNINLPKSKSPQFVDFDIKGDYMNLDEFRKKDIPDDENEEIIENNAVSEDTINGPDETNDTELVDPISGDTPQVDIDNMPEDHGKMQTVPEETIGNPDETNAKIEELKTKESEKELYSKYLNMMNSLTKKKINEAYIPKELRDELKQFRSGFLTKSYNRSSVNKYIKDKIQSIDIEINNLMLSTDEKEERDNQLVN